MITYDIYQLTTLFFLCAVHHSSIEIIICSLKNISINLDRIPVKVLKSICDKISIYVLTSIMNRSPNTGEFPDNREINGPCDTNSHR